MASIRQRGKNSWQITVSNGYDSNGTKLTEQTTVKRPEGFTDKKWQAELEKLALEFETSVQRGTYFAPSHYSVSDFIIKWLDERKSGFENKTLYRYESMLNGRITTVLGHLKLEQIKPLHLLDFYRNLQEVGIREDTKYVASNTFKDLLEENKIALPELATAADISEKTIQGILAGKPTTTAQYIVNALNSKYKLKVKLNKLFTPASELKPLSNKTIQHYHRVLSVMFNDAVRWGMMKENPCLKVQPPKVTRKEMSCLDEEGLSRLIECLELENIRHQAIIGLALMTGCRRGELIGLQWEHIDLENGVINVKQAVSYTPAAGIQIKQPKTSSSIRKVSIPDSTVQLLKQYRKWWLEEKMKVGDQWQKKENELQGDAWKDPEWLFSTWNGYIMHPDTVTSTFKEFIKKHNLPDIRLHDMRHTAATMLINAGLNVRAVASRLGHANPNVTLTVYSHALKSADRQAADIMENLIAKKDTVTDTKKLNLV